jgi:hypothetical protein
MDGYMHLCMKGERARWIHAFMHGGRDGCMKEWVKWIDNNTFIYIYIYIYIYI